MYDQVELIDNHLVGQNQRSFSRVVFMYGCGCQKSARFKWRALQITCIGFPKREYRTSLIISSLSITYEGSESLQSVPWIHENWNLAPPLLMLFIKFTFMVPSVNALAQTIPFMDLGTELDLVSNARRQESESGSWTIGSWHWNLGM
jgi:hypothetical protein